MELIDYIANNFLCTITKKRRYIEINMIEVRYTLSLDTYKNVILVDAFLVDTTLTTVLDDLELYTRLYEYVRVD